MLRRRQIVASASCSRPIDTGAADLTGPTPGPAVEVTLRETVTAVLAPRPATPRGRRDPRSRAARAPTAPGAALPRPPAAAPGRLSVRRSPSRLESPQLGGDARRRARGGRWGRRTRRSGPARPGAAASCHARRRRRRRASIVAGRGSPWALHCTSTSPSTGASTQVTSRRRAVAVPQQVGVVADDDDRRRRGRRRRRSASGRRPAGRAPCAGRPSPARRRRRSPSAAPAVSTTSRRGGTGSGGRGTRWRPPVDVMKHTSWLSGLAAVRRPSAGGDAPHLGLVANVADREQRAGELAPGRACARRSSGPWPGRRRARACTDRRRAADRGRGGRWRRRRSRARRPARRAGRT